MNLGGLIMKLLPTASCTAIALVGLGLSGICAQDAKSGGQQHLDQKVSISASNESLYDFVKSLQDDHKVPLCFIEPDIHTTARKDISFDLHDVSVKSVLDTVVSQVPILKYRLINGRLVLFPDERKYLLPMAVDIENLARFRAVDAYIDKLAERYPSEFGSLLGPSIKGFPGAPIYADKVTVKGTATVLEQLVQLLGDDPRLIFTIMSWKGTPPAYRLGEVH